MFLAIFSNSAVRADELLATTAFSGPEAQFLSWSGNDDRPKPTTHMVKPFCRAALQIISIRR